MGQKAAPVNQQIELIQISYPGWVLLPTRPRKGDNKQAHDARKVPMGSDWQKATKTPDGWTDGNGAFLLCGKISGVVVIDLDDMEAPAVADWLKYAEEHDPLVAVTQKGYHLFIEYDEEIPHRLAKKQGFDIRTDGGGVKLPGDPNEPYRSWHEETPVHNSKLGPAGPALKIIEKWVSKAANTKTTTGRSPLADLLAHRPAEGGRNDWLAQVAGHYVKHLPYEDMFLETVRLINATLAKPLDDEEVMQTVATQWGRYKTGGDETPEEARDALAQASGNIALQGKTFLWVHKDKDGDVLIPLFMSQAQPWPVARVIDPHQSSDIWMVDVGRGKPMELTARKMVDRKAFEGWLAQYGIVLSQHQTIRAPGAELLDVWNRIGVETKIKAPHWGWHEGEWVGLGETEGPDPYKIKLGRKPELLEPLLEEMLLWQTPEVASIFCSWVAAQAVKGKVHFSFEPNLVVRGRAGAGKSRGLFAFGSRLTGAPHQASATTPVIRDSLGWHRNGIVTIDDRSDTSGIEELYRQSTQNNSLTKKGGDNYTETMEFPLLGSMLVSGEVLQAFGNDKALVDRSIVLDIESMQGRRSPHDPVRTQWDDIQDWFERLGGYDEETAYKISGSFVEAALAAADKLGQPRTGDRQGGKADMLRYGAALWAEMAPNARTSDGRPIQDVIENWVTGDELVQDWTKTSLVRQILPKVLRSREAEQLVGWSGDTWGFHLPRIADWWEREHRYDSRKLEIGSKDNMEREYELISSSVDGCKPTRARLLRVGHDRGSQTQSQKTRGVGPQVTELVYRLAEIDVPEEKQRSIRDAVAKLGGLVGPGEPPEGHEVTD